MDLHKYSYSSDHFAIQPVSPTYSFIIQIIDLNDIQAIKKILMDLLILNYKYIPFDYSTYI